MLFVDVARDAIGLHVNGRAEVVDNATAGQCKPD